MREGHKVMMSKINEEKKFTRTALSIVAGINRDRRKITGAYRTEPISPNESPYISPYISPNISPRGVMNIKFSTNDLRQSIQEC